MNRKSRGTNPTGYGADSIGRLIRFKMECFCVELGELPWPLTGVGKS